MKSPNQLKLPKIMLQKIVIPAAGKGTRMLDLAQNIPKHLIHVLDKPFIYYLLKNVQAAGYKEMILVIGHHADKMEEFAHGLGSEFSITLVNQFKVMGQEKYGTAIPVLAAQKAVNKENFVCIYGDNVYSPDDLRAVRELDDEYNWISLLYTKTPEKYGVPILEGDKVKKIIEKPKEFISNWASIGCYKFTPEIFPACEKVGLSPRGEYELTDAISFLAEEGQVKARKMLDYWLDFGRPEDIERVAKFLQEKK